MTAVFRLLWGKKKIIGSGVFDEGAPQILKMLILQKTNGNDHIIMMCILFVSMICLKVLHFVQPTARHTAVQCLLGAVLNLSSISSRLIELYQSNLQQQSQCGTKQPSASVACLVINGICNLSHTHKRVRAVWAVFSGQ